MSRLFFVLLSAGIILMPPLVFADEGADQEEQVLTLYKNYRAKLIEGDTEQALKFAEQMYALTPEVYGKISKTYAMATFNLAQMNDLLRDYIASAKLYQEHIDILDELKTSHDERYLGKLEFLSEAYSKANNSDKAIKYGQKALKLAKGLKLADEELAEYELMLGNYYYFSRNKGNSAKRHFNKAFELFSKSYGEHHIETVRAIFWQATFNLGAKKYSRAADKFETVLNIYKRELNPGHDKILQIHIFLVNVYEKMGEKDKSTEHCIAVAVERPTDFDREIDPLYKVSPKYPQRGATSFKQGYIISEFTVDEFGQVKDIKTLEGKNIKFFEKSAHNALSQFRYAPSIKDGKRVKTEGVTHKIIYKDARTRKQIDRMKTQGSVY